MHVKCLIDRTILQCREVVSLLLGLFCHRQCIDLSCLVILTFFVEPLDFVNVLEKEEQIMSVSIDKTKRGTGNTHCKVYKLFHEIKSSLLHPIIHSLSVQAVHIEIYRQSLRILLHPLGKRDYNSNKTLQKFYRILCQIMSRGLCQILHRVSV